MPLLPWGDFSTVEIIAEALCQHQYHIPVNVHSLDLAVPVRQSEIYWVVLTVMTAQNPTRAHFAFPCVNVVFGTLIPVIPFDEDQIEKAIGKFLCCNNRFCRFKLQSVDNFLALINR